MKRYENEIPMPQAIYQVDAFADRPFAGNPAAVCILPEPREAAWMQNVAREMNLSETAFLVRREDGSYDLRWFTPGVEVDLCGHATLASAHLLWEIDALAPDEEAVFHTQSGRLSARQHDGRIVLNFPAEPPMETEAPAGLIESIGAEPVSVSRNRMDYLLLFDAEATVRSLKPDMSQLAHIDARGVIATAQAEVADYDFVSRFFAPAAGVPEDPVTGSAHCCLGPFWQERLGKDQLIGYQASDRGGIIYVHPDGDRVHLGGHAITVMQGTLLDVAIL